MILDVEWLAIVADIKLKVTQGHRC